MKNAITSLAYALGILFLAGLILAGSIIYAGVTQPPLAAGAMKPAPKELVRVHQGWGLGFCAEDEWYYGFGCLHIDEMQPNDARRNMTDIWYININN